MSLELYKRKRNFRTTAEPKGKILKGNKTRFVVHEHHASHLHFDFRLEIGGVLKSWAIPKGPSLNPKDRRLAVADEDHPVSYINFKGIIDEGNYGAGQVEIWDSGRFQLVDSKDAEKQLEKGDLSFILEGGKLRGQFKLIRMKGRGRQWLLIKVKDQYADPTWELELELKEATDRETDEDDREGSSFETGAATADEAVMHLTDDDILPSVPGAVRAQMPDSIEPMLATLVDEPFSHSEWLYELKWDGVRAICYIKNGQARFLSRNEKEMGFRYPELANIAEYVNAEEVILDGEIVAFDAEGVPNFQMLQSRVGLKNEKEIERLAKKHPVVFYVFDILYYNGFNLMPASLIHRKALLFETIIANNILRYSDHVVGNGESLFEHARGAGLEGIIAKHQGSAYVQRRSSDWLKIKTQLRQEVVIAGYTRPRGTRHLMGALVVGLYRGSDFQYVGHVGGGFDKKKLESIYQLLQPLKTKSSPFAKPPTTNEPVQWVKPKMVCDVKFSQWTADDRLRQPIFIGLRDDKNPAECTFELMHDTSREVDKVEEEVSFRVKHEETMNADKLFSNRHPSGSAKLSIDDHIVSLTHMEKIYWPDEGITKGNLLRYYYKVSEYILPYLKNRPLILKRYPNGIKGTSFFQHDIDNPPAFLNTVSVEAEEGQEIDYALCENLASLLYIVNLGTVAQNPWNSRVASLDHPDWIVFDLDPAEVEWDIVCDVALEIKGLLDKIELDSYAKTSGASGLHIYVPIAPNYSFEQAADFAELVARLVAKECPHVATTERSLKKRKAGQVYVDHLQNARGKSVVSPYSVRAHAGATVAAPISWAEVKRKARIEDFTIKNMLARLAKKGDLFKPVLENKQRLEKAITRLEKFVAAPKAKRARA